MSVETHGLWCRDLVPSEQHGTRGFITLVEVQKRQKKEVNGPFGIALLT